MGEKVFVKGCVAVAEAALRAGCRFFAGYPITPQNDIPEYMAANLPKVGGVFVQGESEVASVNMVYGASATGFRAMTSSSSCGMSLKSEGISYLAGANLPAVICSVMRGGPGVGVIQPSQQDYFQATKAHGNGGFRLLVYAPANLQEAADYTYKAFFKADEYSCPVMVLLDGIQGTMMEPVEFPKALTDEEVAATRTAKEWAVIGRKGDTIHQVDSGHRPFQEEFNKRNAEKYETWKKTETLVEEYMTEDADIIFAAYGISARIALTAIDKLREEGYKVGMIRPITLFPFPTDTFRALDPEKIKYILSIEMSIPPQFTEDVNNAVLEKIPVHTCLRSGGEIMRWEDIVDRVHELCGKEA